MRFPILFQDTYLHFVRVQCVRSFQLENGVVVNARHFPDAHWSWYVSRPCIFCFARRYFLRRFFSLCVGHVLLSLVELPFWICNVNKDFSRTFSNTFILHCLPGHISLRVYVYLFLKASPGLITLCVLLFFLQLVLREVSKSYLYWRSKVSAQIMHLFQGSRLGKKFSRIFVWRWCLSKV